MRTRTWLTGLGAGALMLGGVVMTEPFALAAMQDATPPAQVEEMETEDPNATPIVGTPLLQPTIDLAKAQEIALQGQDGAAVAAVKLDGEDGVLIYDVELDNGLEVEVDATSGEVLKTEQGGGEDDEDETGENGDDGQEDEDESGDVDETEETAADGA